MEAKERCEWSVSDPLYITYHDQEWGFPVRDDQKQFEFLVLESAQAGLSWLTILKRREEYRRLYEGFDPEIVARRIIHKQCPAFPGNKGTIRKLLQLPVGIY